MADVTPETIPTDRDGQVEVLTQALVFVLMHGADHPYPVPVHEVAKMAALAFDAGVRQTADRAEDVRVHLPGWIVQGAREAQESPPPAPDVFGVQESGRVGQAPKPPKRVPKKLLGVVEAD